MNHKFKFDSETFDRQIDIGVYCNKIEVEISIYCGDADGSDAEAEIESIYDTSVNVERDYESFNEVDRAYIDKKIEELCYDLGHEAYYEGQLGAAENYYEDR